jgi:hypothetical protein
MMMTKSDDLQTVAVMHAWFFELSWECCHRGYLLMQIADTPLGVRIGPNLCQYFNEVDSVWTNKITGFNCRPTFSFYQDKNVLGSPCCHFSFLSFSF